MYLLRRSSGRDARYTYFFHKLNFKSTLELNEKNTRKFEKLCTLSSIYIIVCVTIAQICCAMVFTLLAAVTIYLGQTEAPTIVTLLWFVSNLLALKNCGALLLTAFFFVFMVSVYLSLRFQQIYDDMRSFNRFGKIN